MVFGSWIYLLFLLLLRQKAVANGQTDWALGISELFFIGFWWFHLYNTTLWQHHFISSMTTLWSVICSQPFSVAADLSVETCWLDDFDLSAEHSALWSLLCWIPVLVLPQCSNKSLLDYLQVLICVLMLSFNNY